MHITAPDGVRLHVEEIGAGTPILFVHEFGGNHASWEPQLRFFSRRHRCITYAARGYPPSDVPADLEAYSQAIAADDAVGLAAYGMDSHHVQRYVDACGQVQNEGDVEVGGFTPYPISYRAIVPQAAQCSNLLVPVCLSASHIAFGSIRMEPVFMVLGQSAATAAALAIDDQVPVQRVDADRALPRQIREGNVPNGFTQLRISQTLAFPRRRNDVRIRNDLDVVERGPRRSDRTITGR